MVLIFENMLLLRYVGFEVLTAVAVYLRGSLQPASAGFLLGLLDPESGSELFPETSVSV
jgi:hypothetical protein